MPEEGRGPAPDVDGVRAFAEAAPHPIILLTGPTHRLIYANPAFAAACGQDRAALDCRPAAELFPALAEGGHLRLIDLVRTTGEPCRAEARRLPFGDADRLWDAEASAVRGRDGIITGVLVQLRDVTALRRRLCKAEAAAAVLDAVLEHAPIGLAIAGPDGRLLRHSRHGLGFIGREAAGLLAGNASRSGWELCDADGRRPASPAALPLVRALGQGEVVSREQWTLRAWDGEARSLQCSAAPVRDQAGRVAGGILAWTDPPETGIGLDARYRALVEAGALAVWTAAADGTVISMGGWAALTGQTPAQSAGWGWLEALHPEDRPMVRRRWAHSVATGENLEMEYRLRSRDGAWRWTAARATPLRDTHGGIVEWLGANTDIDARKRTEWALRDSEARFRTLAEAMPHLVWQTNPNGEPDYVNSRWRELTGLDLAQLRGGGWLEVVHPEDRQVLAAAWARALAEGGDYDVDARLRDRDGRFRWHRVKAAPICNAVGAVRHWVGTCTDIEERHSAEAQLREALAARERLAREADHRIKNSLQLVAALLRLQAGRVAEPAAREALEAATARVQAVAEAHRALQQSPDFRNIRLADMLRELAAGAAVQHPAADIRTTAPEELTLDAERAIPLALILSELVTQALRQPGPVQLSARLEEGVILAEIEGGTASSCPDKTSLGPTVIRTLARQIAAELTSETLADGVLRVVLRLSPDQGEGGTTPARSARLSGGA
ncbi:PAS domain S-box protein [Belnapia rosea]|uniref:histidine kinase n=1 Tax=Belnapia rosea TaxID=938405 RepID=A0A1G7A3E3_9PROT|nr:PAS domain S-box protein [Belnapia rosea]SDE09153.1 PAS domain S-box-containing protein [Belnapia rosea]